MEEVILDLYYFYTTINGQLSYEKRSDCELYYIYDAEGQLAVINYVKNGTSNSYYVMVNSRGDVEALYTGQGELRVQYRYDSWGNVISVLDGEGEEISSASHIGNVNPFRYRGYYYDVETGFYYVSSRYYDPEVGRFISADGYITTGQGITSYNMYAYCGNNPVNRIDPDGHAWKDVKNWFSKTWNNIKTWAKNTFGREHTKNDTISKKVVPEPSLSFGKLNEASFFELNETF